MRIAASVALLATLLIVVGNDIGPDYCSDGNCSYEEDIDDDNDLSVELDGEDEYCLDEKDCNEGIEANTRDELAKRPTSYVDKFTKPLKFIWKAAKKVASDAYNMTAETLQDIGEVLRTVLNEEAYNMFASAVETFQSSVMPTGRADFFGHTLSRFKLNMLSFSIILLVLFLNYLLFGSVSILTLLVFDCLMFLVHGLLGPAFIAEYIIDFFIFTYLLLSRAISYPIVFCISVVTLFILSRVLIGWVWPSIRRRYCLSSFRTSSDILYNLEEKSRNMERMVEDLQKRTERIEKMLQVVHDHVTNSKRLGKSQNGLQPDE